MKLRSARIAATAAAAVVLAGFATARIRGTKDNVDEKSLWGNNVSK
ncbi:hypothetical protein [Kitasatospora cinereorecta]|uniref:Uncharacterized protein n=1 Tax=Kitasatospora cinereorecta TaxID=285560 RepID=A0ABW0V1V6_9ACTN